MVLARITDVAPLGRATRSERARTKAAGFEAGRVALAALPPARFGLRNGIPANSRVDSYCLVC